MPQAVLINPDGIGTVPKHSGFVRMVTPRPGIAEPDLRYNVNNRFFRAPVVNGDTYKQIVWRALRILHKYVEISVVIENTGVEKVVFRLAPVSPAVLFNKCLIGKLTLRILVKHLHVRVRRRAVEVVV